MSAAEWLADIGKAAEELKLGITELRPDSIELVDLTQRGETHIYLRGYFLTGNELRRLFRPAEDRKPREKGEPHA